MAVANHCQGRNCFFDVEVVFTSGRFDLDSIIYQWMPGGTLREHQRFPTQGASDLKGFVINDALSTGGYADRQFLAITNYRTDSSTELITYTKIWAWDRNGLKFDFQVGNDLFSLNI